MKKGDAERKREGERKKQERMEGGRDERCERNVMF